jgi:hypothetical protein
MAFEALSPAERAKVTDPSSLELSAADRLKLLERLYAERIGGQATDRIAPERMPVSEPDRIRAVSEAALEALTVQVAEQTDIGQSDLRDLARARATTVQRALLATSEINPDRLFLVDVDVGELAVEGKVPTNLRLGTH